MLLSFLRIRLFFVFLLTGGLLFGCVTTAVPPTRFYVLTPIAPGVNLLPDRGKKASISVEVSSLRLPQYLDRPQIVIRRDGNRLELAEYHRWAENLRKNMTRVFAENLSRLLDTPDIAIYPYSPPSASDFRVELEVLQFERVLGGQVKLITQWRLWRGRDQNPLVTRITELESQRVPKQSDLGNTVSAMSDLLGQLSQIIGKEILKHVQERSHP